MADDDTIDKIVDDLVRRTWGDDDIDPATAAQIAALLNGAERE